MRENARDVSASARLGARERHAKISAAVKLDAVEVNRTNVVKNVDALASAIAIVEANVKDASASVNLDAKEKLAKTNVGAKLAAVVALRLDYL